ncbi:hypothetical protein ET445_00395 [Agromyces protaetiae]|uniref:Uncharacterized protein n=1 Tax=Agromyces protaetiae TaxID=2509455 RepID=A0A4P6F901_9MICO|nr:hypothetical protein [Agromyces protaetiae]QAY72016.1 hypothetical protein ET445_00395 [Agromyces protaetiae]
MERRYEELVDADARDGVHDGVHDGVRSAVVLVEPRRHCERVRVPDWATIVRLQLVGAGSFGGAAGDIVEGVMAVRGGTSLRVTLGERGDADRPDGEPTAVMRDGLAVVAAAGGADGGSRARSRPGPLWDVHRSLAERPGDGGARLEFVGPEGGVGLGVGPGVGGLGI